MEMALLEELAAEPPPAGVSGKRRVEPPRIGQEVGRVA